MRARIVPDAMSSFLRNRVVVGEPHGSGDLAREMAKWEQIIRAAGIRAD